MMKKVIPIALAIFCNNAAADLTEELGLKLATQVCLSADFQQQLRDADGAELQRSSGTVMAAKPNKLRWAISAPDTQLIVSDGETLWRYEEDLEQLIVSAFDSESAGLPARLMSGDQTALNAYNIERVENSYQLTPKQPSDLFQFLSLQFNDTGLAAVAMTDSFEQVTQISLSHTDESCDDDALYRFEAPAGIDVIYE